MNKYLTLLIILIVLLTAVPVKACVGARALGMGGAFIVPADNSSAVYWNQAGLTKMEGHEISYSRMLNNRATINYDDFAVAAGYLPAVNLGYGLFFVNEDFVHYDEAGIDESSSRKWYGLALARKLSSDLSVGSAIRLIHKEKVNNYAGKEPEVSNELEFGVDLSLLYYVRENLTTGVLIQNIKSMKFELETEGITYGARIRPGIAYQVNDYWQLAFSIYDLNDFRYQVGTELNLNNSLYLRAGQYLSNPTLGLGVQVKDLRIDYAWLGGKLGKTNLLEVSFQF